MPTRTFDFVNSHGQPLSGMLDLPEGVPRGWALLAHRFTCGRNHPAAVRMARTLAGTGIGVLRFDIPGAGEGEVVDMTFSSLVENLWSAAEAMQAAGMPALLLVGHGLGGTAVLAAAVRIGSARAVASIGAPFDVPDAQPHEQAARIAALHRPLLLLHSPRDDEVDVDNATRIYQAARQPKSHLSLDEADHLLSGTGDAEHAAHLIAAWAARYLPAVPDPGPPPFDAEAEETGLGKYQLALRSGGSRWLADEPASLGGLGSGPTPYDLLASALAACTTMTLRHFADSRGWPVTRIRTAVNHARDKALAPPDVFSRHVFIEGAIDEAQRAQLLEVVQRCPVHRTLEQGARMQPAIVDLPVAAGELPPP
ncbi:bifunctional alpha/beta hydrolase/OsmC family protein [Streptococcus pyogenes]|uniref:bifunctional alpha/beta hydrolase/OsmC family protein n=1 Tax=Streptococcus pyogenes TaxID=1314 RepID=UPI003DA0F4DD